MNGWTYGGVLGVGLVFLEGSALLWWGFEPSRDDLGEIAQMSISLGSISVGVVGLLLSLFVTQELANNSEAAVFRLLISSVMVAVLIAFAAGIGALVARHGICSPILGELTLHGLVGSTYIVASALALSTLEILFIRRS